MRDDPSIPGRSFGGVVMIAVTYVYFLLYAQFGFVSYLKLAFPDPVYTERSMGMMGLGGISFSILAAVLLRRVSARLLLAVGFAGAGGAALLTLVRDALPVFYSSAFIIGGFTGLLTVTLAASLRQWIPARRFGLHVGFGTGLAYLICNIPVVFDAAPAMQTVFSALVCVPGVWIAMRSRPRSVDPSAWQPRLAAAEYAGLGFVSVILMFMALVWLDSTAFATIQLTESLRARTWGTGMMKFGLGLFHFVAAVAAGWLIDRARMRGLLAGVLALFAASFLILQSDLPARWVAGPLYAIGISIYSTALVAFPSLHPEQTGLVSMRWRAAILYAVAGWIASGLGVGMAQHLHSIPWYLVAIAAVFVGGGLLFPLTPTTRRNIAGYGLSVFAGAAALAYYGFTDGVTTSVPEAPTIEQGRAVYRQEGCIHCHSQYLRPDSPDIVPWGPYRPIDRTERPPMVGNRRQGPDLMNAGLRRSPDWHRQHLKDPSSLSPGSRMPSYAFLFREGDTRGESLVMYLSSLGRDHAAERAADIAAWMPSTDLTPSPERGATIFQRQCSMCHGRDGQGDGPLAPLFLRPAMVLTKGAFLHVAPGLEREEQAVALARVVKFGLMGLGMPGHELMPDRDVADVVSYVQNLAAKGPGGP